MIAHALQSTAVHDFTMQIEQIYSVYRFVEAMRFAPFHRVERKMLWHGSRDSNMAGILTEGLRVAPD